MNVITKLLNGVKISSDLVQISSNHELCVSDLLPVEIYKGKILGSKSQISDFTPYHRVKVFAILQNRQQAIFEIDLTTQSAFTYVSGYPYFVNYLIGAGDAATRTWEISCGVNSDKSKFYIHRFGYYENTVSNINEVNNNGECYVYKILGYKW